MIERVYAAITIYAAGIWLSAATAIGPFRAAASASPGNRRAYLVGAVVGASAPARESHGSSASCKPGPISPRPSGWPGPRSCPPPSMCGDGARDSGWHAARPSTNVIAKIPAIESGLGTFRGAVRVYPTPDDLANRCEIRVLDMDPHAGAIPWPGPSVTSITQPIDLGPFEDAVTVPGAFRPPAWHFRRHYRVGQKRWPQCAHG